MTAAVEGKTVMYSTVRQDSSLIPYLISVIAHGIITYIKLLKPYWLRDATTGLTFNKHTFCPHCIYVFFVFI